MVFRTKPSPTVTRLTGGRPETPIPPLDPDIKSNFWLGSSASEPASTTSGFTTHIRVPTEAEKDDPRGAFTPVAGGIQINYPGTYHVEGVVQISGGAANVRYGAGFVTTGDISPLKAANTQVLGGTLFPAATVASPWCNIETVVVVRTAGAKVLVEDFVQSATSHTATLNRIKITKIAQGAPGPQGIPGPEGDLGPPGTRWGTTTGWGFVDTTDLPCTMADGGLPRVGDIVISTNGFSVGEVSTITAVYPSGNIDISYPEMINLRGPRGAGWGTVNVSFPGAAGATLTGVTVTMPTGMSWPRPGDVVQNLHPDHIGDVYYVESTTYASTTCVIKKYTPVQNIRGATGPAGSALSHWPIDSVYISYSSANPAALFGGTWAAIGTGRMLIGVDPADAAMDVAGDTGGAKTTTLITVNLPPHNHSIDHGHTLRTRDGSAGGTQTSVALSGGGAGAVQTGNTAVNDMAGNSGPGPGTSTPFTNLPPYLAVYMWRRTA